MAPRLPRRRAGIVDAPITGAADPQMTVLSLLEEMRAVRLKDSEFYREAEMREAVFLGEQTPEYDPAMLQVAAPPYDLRAPMHENVLMPAVTTLVSRVDQGRIDAKCWPHTPTPARIAAAEGGNLILAAERTRQRRDMKVHEALIWALVHGESGIYTTWDESYGPVEAIEEVINPDDGFPAVDPATGQPVMQLVEEYGGIRVEVLSTFKFWTSGEDNPEDTRWQVRERIVDKYTARARLLKSGIQRDVTERSFKAKGNRRARVGVQVLELWCKPGAMIEPGMFALVVDDCVCLPTANDKQGNAQTNPDGSPATAQTPSVFPYRHKRLPISVLSCMRVDDTPHGHTVVKDGIAQQRLTNVALRSILRRADIAGDARLIGVDDVIDGIDSERDGRIRYNGDKPVQAAAMWLTGAEIPNGLVGVYQNMGLAGVNRVIGVSEESVSGGDPSSTSSGEQLKTAAALDSQKTVPLRRRAEMAWEESDKQVIELFRERASKARLVSVIGDPVRAMYLAGADLDGVDVALESASGLAESHQGQSRAAEEGAAAGFTPPQDAGEMRQTGGTETIIDGEMRARIEKQGAAALRGQAQQPFPDVPGEGAARILRMMLAKAPVGRTASLLALIASYEQMQPPGPPAPPPGGPGAPAQGGRPKVTATAQAAQNNAPPGVIQ